MHGNFSKERSVRPNLMEGLLTYVYSSFNIRTGFEFTSILFRALSVQSIRQRRVSCVRQGVFTLSGAPSIAVHSDILLSAV